MKVKYDDREEIFTFKKHKLGDLLFSEVEHIVF